MVACRVHGNSNLGFQNESSNKVFTVLECEQLSVGNWMEIANLIFSRLPRHFGKV